MILHYILLWCVLLGQALCQSGLSSVEKQAILNAHNELRGFVKPTAANMQRMAWNNELALVAQNYAQKCVFQHNSNRTSQQKTFKYVGENLYAGSGRVNYTKAVASWYNEVKDYSYYDNKCNGTTCGHYTQVVWATSNSLGCGVYRCTYLQNAGSNWLVFVCNYGPGGNYNGQQPYKSGKSCSLCSSNTHYCVNNACSDKQRENHNQGDVSMKDAINKFNNSESWARKTLEKNSGEV